MQIIRTNYTTGTRHVVNEYEDITTHTAEQFMVNIAKDEAKDNGLALQVNYPGGAPGLSGRATATLYDASGLVPLVHYHQEWPQS